MGHFIGEFEGDVMKELLVDDDDPAQPTGSLFHRCAVSCRLSAKASNSGDSNSLCSSFNYVVTSRC